MPANGATRVRTAERGRVGRPLRVTPAACSVVNARYGSLLRAALKLKNVSFMKSAGFPPG